MSDYINIKIDELDIAKSYFERKNKDIISSINYSIRNNAINDILILVTKYLYHNNINPKDIRYLIYKYALILIYFDLYNSKLISSDMNENKLNDLCYFSINLNDFISFEFESKFFKKIYEDNDNDLFKEKNNELKEKGYKALACFSSIYRMNFNYHQMNFDISYSYTNKNMTNYDLIVADVINDNDFINLDISFDSSFNINTKSTGAELRSLHCFMALVLKDNIDNDNYLINDVNVKSSYIKVLSRCKEFAPTKLDFIMKDDLNIYRINYELVKPFKFIYDNVNYEFNENGIVKL